MNKVKLGFAQTVITPNNPSAVFLDGYGDRLSPANSVRDDLYAKVCVFISGEQIFILFSLDLIGLRERTYELVSDQISEITGIDKSNFALACTHTHSAPATGLLDENPINYDYFAFVGTKCAEIAKTAINNACEGTVSYEILPEELQYGYNRRGRDVINRSIRCAVFRDGDQKIKGAICSANCHAVIQDGQAISADWLSELNKISTPDTPIMFLQGRGADIDPQMHIYTDREQFTVTMGKSFADSITNGLHSSVSQITLNEKMEITYEYARIPMLKLTDAQALKDKAKELLNNHLTHPDEKYRHYFFRELQWHRKMLRMIEMGEDFAVTVPLQMMKIGKQCAFLFIPFELLTLTGDKLEKLCVDNGYAPQSVFVCGYTNVTMGYLAPPEEFETGGYEVDYSAQWYNIPYTSTDSEPAVIKWFENHIK